MLPVELLSAVKKITAFEWLNDSLYFITDLDGKTNIWKVSPDNNYPLQITLNTGSIISFKPSPDSKKIAFLADSGGRERYELFTINSFGGDMKRIFTSGVIEYPDFSWAPDCERIVYISKEDKSYNLNIVSTSTGRGEKITDTKELKRDVRWSCDGEKIAYFSMGDRQDGHVSVFSFIDKKIKKMTSSLGGVNSYPRWSPHGSSIAFVSDGEGLKKIGIISFPEGNIKWLPSEIYEQNLPEWSPDGKKILYISNRYGNMIMSIYDIIHDEVRESGFKEGVVSSARWSHDGSSIAFRYHSPLNAPDLYIIKNNEIKKITNSMAAPLIENKFSSGSLVFYPSAGGENIPAFLYKQPDEEKHPAIIWVHGGPAHQHFNGWDPSIQFLISLGLVVLAPNIRGSTGRGSDYENAIFKDWGGIDLEDIISGAKYLKSLDFIQDDCVFIGGASYGGFMTMTALVKAPELWAGGLNFVGPVNLGTFYNSTSGWLKNLLIDKYGFLEPEQDEDFYKNRSPVNFIENINVPLLLIYSGNDARVPKSELDLLLVELEKYKKDYEYTVFENEGHSFSNPLNELQIYKKMSDFIIRVLREKQIKKGE